MAFEMFRREDLEESREFSVETLILSGVYLYVVRVPLYLPSSFFYDQGGEVGCPGFECVWYGTRNGTEVIVKYIIQFRELKILFLF